MFLKQITQKSGRTKLCVYESYRDGRRTRQRTVRALGYVDELAADLDDGVRLVHYAYNAGYANDADNAYMLYLGNRLVGAGEAGLICER